MQQICITASSTAEDLESIAICVHELFWRTASHRAKQE